MTLAHDVFRWLGWSLTASLLAACGGGGGGGSSDGGASNPPTTTSITVAPSLGAVTYATVNIYKADGTTVVGSGDLGSAGIVTINIINYSGPIVIEVAGDADAQYFDEAVSSLVDLPANKTIHAIAPVSSGNVAVTALTELAYQSAVVKNIFPLTDSRVNQLNEKIRLALAPEITHVLNAPTPFNSKTTANSLGNDDAGKYALKLAALAQLGNGQAAPMLAVIDALNQDLTDGVIDGKDAGNASVNAPYSNFPVELTTKLSLTAANFATPELKSALASYPALTARIEIGGGTLTVSNAPPSIGGAFLADSVRTFGAPGTRAITWTEDFTSSSGELLTVHLDSTDSDVAFVVFAKILSTQPSGWVCATSAAAPCSGIAFDKAANTITFVNTELPAADGNVLSNLPITLNGTLSFTAPTTVASTTTTSSSTTSSTSTTQSTSTTSTQASVTTTTQPTSSVTLGNNSALLSGAAIGKGIAAVNDLRKQIAVTVLGASPSFTVGTAFATRTETSTDFAYVAIPVTNNGSQTRCFVQVAGIVYRDSNGTAIPTTGIDGAFVEGSVGKISSTFTNTCLSPGETGFALDVKGSLYNAVAKMEFTLSSNNSTVSAPVASVIPKTYAVQAVTNPSSPRTIEITAQNVGSAPALVGGQSNFHTWFLLDGAGQPLTFGFVDSTTPTVISPTTTATMIDSVYYDGPAATQLRVFVDFEDASIAASLNGLTAKALSSVANCSATLPKDEFDVCRIASRNSRLSTLELLAQ